MRLFHLWWYGLILGMIGSWAQAGSYGTQSYRLKNGLEVIVLENHRAPLVMHMMAFKVGTNDSPWGKSGLAHYLEHLMFKGKPTSAAGRIMRDINRLGGESNAITTPVHTFYYELVPTAHLETVMKLDAERMAQLEIHEDWARPEINVILEERSMRIENVLGGTFFETLNAVDIHHHPSRLPTIGWAQEIKGYTTEDAQKFYQNWYVPNNAFLMIAGDVTFKQAVALAEKYYGAIPARPLPPRLNLQEPSRLEAQQSLEMKSNLLETPLYVARYSAPSFDSKNPVPFYALIVLEDLLNRPMTGRLTSIFVDKNLLATQFSLSYSGLQPELGTFQISMMPSPTVSLEQLEKALAQEIQKILEEGISSAEVEQAKNSVLSELTYTQDNMPQVAQTLVSLYASGFSLEEIEKWKDRIQAITPQQVNEVLHQVLGAPARLKGRLWPVPSKTSQKS